MDRRLDCWPWAVQEGELGEDSRTYKTAEEEQCTLGNKTVIGRHARGLCFQKVAWGDGHN